MLHCSALSQGRIPSALTYDRSHCLDRIFAVPLLLQECSDVALPVPVLLCWYDLSGRHRCSKPDNEECDLTGPGEAGTVMSIPKWGQADFL